MPDSEAKKKWMKENSIIFPIKMMKRTEQDLLDYIEEQGKKGIQRGTLFKKALREYMENNKEETS